MLHCWSLALLVAALGTGCSSDPAPNAPPPSKEAGREEAAVDAPPSPACSPGTRLDPYDKSIECSGGLCICRTYAPDGGLLMPVPEVGAVRTDVISFQLPEPMKAGQAYAFSVTLASNNYLGDVEFWGANEECGAGLEKLSTEPFASKVYCADVHPSQDYSYVLFVRQYMGTASGSFASQSWEAVIACPTGKCP